MNSDKPRGRKVERNSVAKAKIPNIFISRVKSMSRIKRKKLKNVSILRGNERSNWVMNVKSVKNLKKKSKKRNVDMGKIQELH